MAGNKPKTEGSANKGIAVVLVNKLAHNRVTSAVDIFKDIQYLRKRQSRLQQERVVMSRLNAMSETGLIINVNKINILSVMGVRNVFKNKLTG